MFVETAAGIIIILVVLFDIFQTVLVPRYTPSSLRFMPVFISRVAWPVFRSFSRLIRNETLQDLFLGTFAPLVFVCMFLLSLAVLTFGYALIMDSMGSEFAPAINGFQTALYAAGTALLTLGFGDIVAKTNEARMVMLLAATTGISVVAIGVSFLFSLQQSVHAREEMVHILQTRIQPANSAVSLLINYADMGIEDLLTTQIDKWESWSAKVLTSHRSFPLLCYFRSGHLSVPWLTVIGVILDCTNLLSSTINDKRYGHAIYQLQIGSRMLKSFCEYFGLKPAQVSADRQEFCDVYMLLCDRNYKLHSEDKAWENFRNNYGQYAPWLIALAKKFVCDAPTFISHIHKIEAKELRTQLQCRAEQMEATNPAEASILSEIQS